MRPDPRCRTTRSSDSITGIMAAVRMTSKASNNTLVISIASKVAKNMYTISKTESSNTSHLRRECRSRGPRTWRRRLKGLFQNWDWCWLGGDGVVGRSLGALYLLLLRELGMLGVVGDSDPGIFALFLLILMVGFIEGVWYV